MERNRPTREQLIHLAKTDPEGIADLVLILWDRVEILEAKVAELERNSRNSSKPPSSDKGNLANSPKPKSLRGKSGKKPGGQKGHKGDTLSRSSDPDHIVEHCLGEDQSCLKCGTSLAGVGGVTDADTPLSAETCECRQVFELPAIRLIITEHRAEKRNCPGCGESVTAAFPAGVNAPVQYGENVKATAIYLNTYQLIPYARLSEAFSDLFTARISGGTLTNFVKVGGINAAETMEPVREALVAAPVAHADETGCKVNGIRNWLHVFST